MNNEIQENRGKCIHHPIRTNAIPFIYSIQFNSSTSITSWCISLNFRNFNESKSILLLLHENIMFKFHYVRKAWINRTVVFTGIFQKLHSNVQNRNSKHWKLCKQILLLSHHGDSNVYTFSADFFPETQIKMFTLVVQICTIVIDNINWLKFQFAETLFFKINFLLK